MRAILAIIIYVAATCDTALFDQGTFRLIREIFASVSFAFLNLGIIFVARFLEFYLSHMFRDHRPLAILVSPILGRTRVRYFGFRRHRGIFYPLGSRAENRGTREQWTDLIPVRT